MTALLAKSPPKAPTRVTSIDWTNPITQGLVFAGYPLGQTWVDAVSGQVAMNQTGNSFPRQYAPPKGWLNPGVAMRGRGVSDWFQWTKALASDALTGTVFSCFVEGNVGVNGGASTQIVVASTSGGNGDAFAFAFDDAGGSATNGFVLRANNAPLTGTSTLGANSEQFLHRIGVSLDGTNLRYYANGALAATIANSTSITADSSRRMQIFGRVLASGNTAVGSFAMVWKRTLKDVEFEDLTFNPWQIFKQPSRRLWKAPVAVAQNYIGGGLDNLQALIDQGGGNIGVQGGGRDILQALQSFGGGSVQTQNYIGGGLNTLHALQAFGGAKIGVKGGGLDSLQALQSLGGGTNDSPQPEPPQAGGAPAWWGYEGFDGTGRPWWYSDLKDKARELERQRKLRVDLGILPAAENKKIKRVVRQAESFAEEYPTPQTADYFIARQEEISARVEALIDQLEEEDDEQVIMQMAQFFFPRNNQKPALWTH